MPDNGSGTYALPQAAFTSGTTISSAAVNSDFADIATALNNRLTRNGESAPSANVPMGTFKHTNVGNATARTEYATAGQIADGALVWGGTSTGSANVHAISPTPGVPAYVAGARFSFLAGFTSTAAATLAVSGLAAKSIFQPNGASTPNLIAGSLVEVLYDGAAFRLVQPTAGYNVVGAPINFGVATALVQYALPVLYRRYRLEFIISAVAASFPFARFSTDNGATFKQAAADYLNVNLSIRAASTLSGGVTAGYLQLSDAVSGGQIIMGTLEFDSGTGLGLFDTHTITSAPQRTRMSGSFNTAFGGLGVITDVQMGLGGGSMASGAVRLVGGQ